MGATLWSFVGIAIAVAALVVTVWQGNLIRRQLDHANRVSHAQFYQQITMMCLERDRLFTEHPELWAYFYSDHPVPSDEVTRGKVFSASRMLADLAEGCVAGESVLGEFSGDWDRYFRYIYTHSPSFRTFWVEHGQFWPLRVQQSFTGRTTDAADRQSPDPEN